MFRATFYPKLIAMLSMLCTIVACKNSSPERLRIPVKSSFGQLLLPATPTPPARHDTGASWRAHYPAGAVYSAPYVHAHHEVVREALHQMIRDSSPLPSQSEHPRLDVHKPLGIGMAGLRLLFAPADMNETIAFDASLGPNGAPAPTQGTSGEPDDDERTLPTP